MSGRPPSDPRGVTAEAADWYVRLRSGSVSVADAAEFEASLRRNPGLRRELDELDQLWHELAGIQYAPEILAERKLILGQRGGGGKVGVQSDGPAEKTPVLAGVRRRVRLWAIAASILVAVSAVWYRAHLNIDYTTAVGEQRVIPLDDGSVVTLNTDSELRLHFTPTLRAVELVAGQANFEVAKDPQRPFVVRVGDGEVRAVGTVFDVYKVGEKVTVTLIEGRVAVRAVDDGRTRERSEDQREQDTALRAQHDVGAEIMLTAGEQVSYGVGTPIAKSVPADLRRISAWRARKLDFKGTVLADAIAEANRYSNIKIELRVPELEDARISGVFEVGKNELFAEGLQSFFGLQAERTADNRIVLTARRGSSDVASHP